MSDEGESTGWSGPGLLCPLDSLPLERVPAGDRGLAVHFCGRHEYPEVCGIPALLDTPATRRALVAVRAADAGAARGELLVPDRWGRGETLARAADRLLSTDRFSVRQRSRRIAAFRARHGNAAWATYRDALAALLLGAPCPEPEGFHYFLNRPSDPTFVVAEAVASAVPPAGDVLDLCCGTGQVTGLLVRGGARTVVGVDELWALLFLAKTYLAPEARLVCARADRPLPFADGTFDSVVCSDALHDTTEPAILAREILRVKRPRGTAFVVHLHNPAFAHAYAGRNPLAPEGYAAIFAAQDPRLLDEGPILDRWIDAGEVDLAASRPPLQLGRARTIALLAGSRAPDRLHRPVAVAPAHLGLSPLYRAQPDGESFRLNRTWPSELYAREYPDAAKYLPVEALLGPTAVAALRSGRLAAEAVELFRRRVLVDVSASYGAERPWARRET